MKGFWWKLPGLRKLSPLQKGLLEALGVTLATAVMLLLLVSRYFSDPSGGICANIAQILATLLVAFAVQTGWLLQNSRERGAKQENWVGIASGIGISALIGIGIGLVLTDHPEGLSWAGKLGFAWMIASLALLGVMIALQPYATYEWAHSLNAEYPDE